MGDLISHGVWGFFSILKVLPIWIDRTDIPNMATNLHSESVYTEKDIILNEIMLSNAGELQVLTG